MASVEEDEAGGRRTTRGRNPLPPTKGPLFPPLPPKQPKPKLSSTSTPRSASSSTVPVPSADDTAVDQSSNPSRPPSDAGDKHVPSGSGTSLTPPPTSEPPAEDGTEADAEEVASRSKDAWASYQRQRKRRSFGEANGSGAVVVKQEEALDDAEDEDTPRRVKGGGKRSGSRRASAVSTADKGSPAISRSGSGMDLGSRQSRKRRGEEQLLLDDHLLPEEMKRTGQLTGKRDRPASGTVPTLAKKEVGQDKESEESTDEADGAAEQEEEPTEQLTEPDVAEEQVEDAQEVDEEADEEEGGSDEEGDGGEVTRCVCQREDGDPLMISCDTCQVWQHGPCMGIWADEEAPDEYFCEECKPDLHQPLKRYIRSRGRNIATFAPPTPEELLKLHYASDKSPPSQSKRWTDPSLLKAFQKTVKKGKDLPSPIESVDARRSGRSRPAPLPVKSQKPISATSIKPEKDVKRPDSSPRRRVSIAELRSMSPRDPAHSPGPAGFPGKRRSTMNSRDSAYEEAQIRAALEASRQEMFNSQERELDPEDVEGGAADEDTEMERAERRDAKKGKRKRDGDDTASVEASGTPAPGGKAKHPNQYTYRPKPVVSSIAAAPSPVRRGPGTPVPTLPPPAQHEHGTRRAGAIASGLKEQPYTAVNVNANTLSWHLPEHLSAYSELLPAPHPSALEVRSPRVMPYLPRTHFHNQRYGPFDTERDDRGKLRLPGPPRQREPEGDPETHLEPPTRVKYPIKRMTMADMRRRVRSILDWVNKVRADETRRVERTKILGLDISELPPIPLPEENEDVEMAEVGQEDPNGESQTTKPARAARVVDDSPRIRHGDGKTAAELLDELSHDLVTFQENYAAGLFAPTAHGSGDRPNGSVFGDSVPPTPVLPDQAHMVAVPLLPSVEDVGEAIADVPRVASAMGGEADVEGNGFVTSPISNLPLDPAPLDPTIAGLADAPADSEFETDLEPEQHFETLGKVVGSTEDVKVVEQLGAGGLDVYREGEVGLVVADKAEERVEVGEMIEAGG